MAVAYLFTFQERNAAGHTAGDVYSNLSLDVAGCGAEKEWVMVEPVRVLLGGTRGRPRGRGGRAGRARGGHR